MSRPKSVAIVGVTGAVGAEMVRCLEQRNFPVSTLKPLASARSAGKSVRFRGQDLRIEELSERAFDGVDIALFAASSDIAKQYAPGAAANGAIVIDNSSAYRMAPDVPLVIPEVNADALAGHKNIIANPNCTGAIMVMALYPLHQANPIQRVIASTYQAASGAGAEAMQELIDSTRAYLAGQTYEPKVLPHPYAFNVFSHNDKVDMETLYNGEEMKVMAEMRKTMRAPALRVGITCVRVPVLRAHLIALNVEFSRPMAPGEAKALLEAAPGVRIVDDPARNYFPMPLDASGQDDVLVGRFRTDLSDPSGKSLALMVAGDQLLKGAALNAVQIAERLL